MIGWLRRLFVPTPAPDPVEIERVPPGDGWHYWLHVRPPADAGAIELWRAEWSSASIWRLSQIPPEMNVSGLYWRWPMARLVND